MGDSTLHTLEYIRRGHSKVVSLLSTPGGHTFNSISCSSAEKPPELTVYSNDAKVQFRKASNRVGVIPLPSSLSFGNKHHKLFNGLYFLPEEGLGHGPVVPFPAYGFAALVSNNNDLNSLNRRATTATRPGLTVPYKIRV